MTFLVAWIGAHWRVVALAGGLIVVGWWHEHEVTKAYRKGTTDGEFSTLQKEAVRIEAETLSRRRQFDQEQVRLDSLEARIQGERSALVTARQSIESALSSSLSQFSGQEAEVRNDVQAIPDNALNGKFRDALAHARSSELAVAGGAIVQPDGAEPGRDPRGNPPH